MAAVAQGLMKSYCKHLNLPLLEQRLHEAPVTLSQAGVVDADSECQSVLQCLIPGMNRGGRRGAGAGAGYFLSFTKTPQL